MIFSEQNLKKAYKDLLSNPTLEYKEWMERNFAGKEVDIEEIRKIVDLWNELEGLPNVRKMDANVRKEVGSGIKTYGIDECMQAVKNYAEVLNADYFLNYIWNIRTFFKQNNALPEFMADGSKWLNYVRDTGKQVDSDKKKPWSSLSLERQTNIKDEVSETLDIFRQKVWPLITVTNPNLSVEEYDSQHLRSFENAVIKAFPIIFAKVADDNGVFLDNDLPVTGTHDTFKTSFEYVIISAHGRQKGKWNFKDEFEKYPL